MVRARMTVPGVAALDVAFVLSVAGVAALFGTPLSAGLAVIVGAAYFGLAAWIEDHRTPAK